MLMIEFLESQNGDISVTKFLNDSPYPHIPEHPHPDLDLTFSEDEEDDYNDSSDDEGYYDANDIMSNDQQIEKNAKKHKKSKKNKSKKSKKPFGGPDEDVVFVEFLEYMPYPEDNSEGFYRGTHGYGSQYDVREPWLQ